MKSENDHILPSLIMIPILAALVGIITLLTLSSLHAQSAPPSYQDSQKGPIKLHVSVPLRGAAGHIQPAITLGVRNNRNEWSLTTTLAALNPVRVGIEGAYTRFLRDDGHVIQPFVRFSAGRQQYASGSISEAIYTQTTSVSAMVGTRIYPFKEGFHFEFAAGPTLGRSTPLQPSSGTTVGKSTFFGISGRVALGYDFSLSRKPAKEGRNRVKADLKGQ